LKAAFSFDHIFPFWLRAFVRAREVGLVLVALVIGLGSGLLVALISILSQRMHELIYGIPWNSYLSVQSDIVWWRVLMGAPLGALVLALLTLWAGQRFKGRIADAIEANALQGGRMSFAGSAFITVQTFVSNACGVSVGLEAAYTQICAAFSSLIGRGLAARRQDMRLLVGCGAAGAIAAAFNAPLAGAFYAFEVVLGAYNVASLVPVVASAVAASLVSGSLVHHQLLDVPATLQHITGISFLLMFLLAALCALASIMLMKGVAFVEALFDAARMPSPWRPMVGGICVGMMALVTPQLMGSGHGAVHLNIEQQQSMMMLVLVLSFKSIASMITLGSGFRGGLFFASLLLGSLLGRLFAQILALFVPLGLDPVSTAIAGMAALGTGVIGAPITMTVLALEMTGDFSVTVASLVACAVTSLLVRELFGYSFATWRFHLRGETIRGPHDIGWLRDLTVERMMRRDVRTVLQTLSIAQARETYPLGSERHLFLTDEAGHYAGLVLMGELYAAADDHQPLSTLAGKARAHVLPSMTIRDCLGAFEHFETDVLPVLASETEPVVLGLVTEAHALRRYGEELERRNGDIAPR